MPRSRFQAIASVALALMVLSSAVFSQEIPTQQGASVAIPPTLTIASQNPNSGVTIAVYPADLYNRTNGATQFTRQYFHLALVTLTAPPAAPNGYLFCKWLKDGADFTYNSQRAALCSMGADRTMTAIYAHPANTSLLTVASSNSGSGVTIAVYPKDRYNRATGTTEFICFYAPYSLVTLTAPVVAPNGYVFSHWLKDGADFAGNTNRGVLCSMGADHTMTAVYVHPSDRYFLTVNSSYPGSGIPIAIYPADRNGRISGSTSFVSPYSPMSLVTLTAPATTPYGDTFLKWQKDGADFANNTHRAVTCSMSGDHTMTAIYGSQPGSIEMVPVPAGMFLMGNCGRGDDLPSYDPLSDESPTHTVTLSPYQIGKYHVSNGQYCSVLNWALARGYVKGDASGSAYAGGMVYAAGQPLLSVSGNINIQYAGGSFSWTTRAGTGGDYSMRDHPVVLVTWYGAVVFCNWQSEKDGLTPCYNLTNWSLIPGNNGYRLPTEAEWERAAAWDGSKHWIYGFMSDTLTGKDRCNYCDHNPDYVNPMGLTTNSYSPMICTSPVGWFNGTNISPNGNIQTVNSPSPVGCYDMSGNASEWCHDWYNETYYSGGAMVNPTGATSGSYRIHRGGGWADISTIEGCRSAARDYSSSDGCHINIGFRVARGIFGP